MNMKKILLTGASGSVGFQVFQELLRRQDRYCLRILCLNTFLEKKVFNPYQDEVEVFWGDIRNPDDVNKAVQGVDVILHIAGIIPPAADQHPELARAVNVNGTKNVVDASSMQNNPPKIIFTSSISVYGDRLVNPEIIVGDPLNPSKGDEYARTKIDAENIIRNSGLQWTIFRLCGILVNKLRIQPLMFHMPLETALEWCHDVDAAYALVQGIENDSIIGRTFNLGGGEACRTKARDFLRQMFPLWGLELNLLPDYAFATRNFHSGFYMDGDELDNLLHFRRKTLQDYLDAMRVRISPIQRRLVQTLPKSIVRAWMLKMSDPLKAIRENNEELVNRFYGSREVFECLFQGDSLQVG